MSVCLLSQISLPNFFDDLIGWYEQFYKMKIKKYKCTSFATHARNVLVNREELGAAPDAHYDSKLLMRVAEEYCGVSQTLQIMVDTYTRASENVRRHVMYHLSTSKSRGKRMDKGKFLYKKFDWFTGKKKSLFIW